MNHCPSDPEFDRQWDEMLDSLRAEGMSDQEIDDLVQRATENVAYYSKHPCQNEDIEDCDLSVGGEP